jgi:hypothetical protein
VKYELGQLDLDTLIADGTFSPANWLTFVCPCKLGGIWSETPRLAHIFCQLTSTWEQRSWYLPMDTAPLLVSRSPTLTNTK